MRQIQTASSNINCKFLLRNKAHSNQIKEQLEHIYEDRSESGGRKNDAPLCRRCSTITPENSAAQQQSTG
jgi:hypothetical protein